MENYSEQKKIEAGDGPVVQITSEALFYCLLPPGKGYYRIHRTGGPEVMQLESLDIPEPGPVKHGSVIAASV